MLLIVILCVIVRNFKFDNQFHVPLNTEAHEGSIRKMADPQLIEVSEDYAGPRPNNPLTSADLEVMITAFKQQQILHAHYLIQILHQARNILQDQPNIRSSTTSMAKQITVCGDIHGKLDDLLVIFYKNGLPSIDNPYVFNGDFVDRGPQSTEVLIVLLSTLILNPNEVFLNRGNHEDPVLNLRYGFIKEISKKYSRYATVIFAMIQEVYSWLPLATIVDNEVFIVHGGISDRIDLNTLSTLPRNKLVSLLRRPHKEEVNDNEWSQAVDLLWSDPRPQNGSRDNSFRGGGSYFGPDVTERFLKKSNLSRIIRSHECKLDGYEFTHGEKVLTVFSASNYYEVGSNRGAYVKLLGDKHEPHIVRFQASRFHRDVSINQRLGTIEKAALDCLREQILVNKAIMLELFRVQDPQSTGEISISDWTECMQNVIGHNIPWRLLCTKLSKISVCTGNVLYMSTFEDLALENKLAKQGPGVVETLYKNRNILEAIFLMIDKDNSGKISMDEFSDACNILSKHRNAECMPPGAIQDMASSIDINKDGFIDFNEFLEAFRLVSKRPERGNDDVLNDVPQSIDKKTISENISTNGKTEHTN
ncbi:PPEF1 (predicted) [Pycnogonum litorale]